MWKEEFASKPVYARTISGITPKIINQINLQHIIEKTE